MNDLKIMSYIKKKEVENSSFTSEIKGERKTFLESIHSVEPTLLNLLSSESQMSC